MESLTKLYLSFNPFKNKPEIVNYLEKKGIEVKLDVHLYDKTGLIIDD